MGRVLKESTTSGPRRELWGRVGMGRLWQGLGAAGAGGAGLSGWVELCHRRGLAGRKFPEIRPHRAISTDFRLKLFPVEKLRLHEA